MKLCRMEALESRLRADRLNGDQRGEFSGKQDGTLRLAPAAFPLSGSVTFQVLVKHLLS